MTTLQRKLWRELWQLRLQLLSIALVVAAGVMTVVTMNGSYWSLLAARDQYYQQTRFADVWVGLKRAPQSLVARVAALPGVMAAEARVTSLARLDLGGEGPPAEARMLGLPAPARPAINNIVLLRGRYLADGTAREVIVSEKFAAARDLQPGAEIAVILNGRRQRLTVVGVASSPEHSYAVPPGSLLPDYRRFGVLWVGSGFLAAALDMEGGFNELTLRLESTARREQVIASVDALLEPQGGLGAYGREDQVSALVLANEMRQLRVLGSLVPAIFLGVAMFLLHQVMERLISTQRGEIAILKAFGYRDLEAGLHFLGFALAPAVLGAALGMLAGVQLGAAQVSLYGEYFELPELAYRTSLPLLLLAAGASLLAAISGAASAVQKVVRLPPSVALQPAPPATYHSGWLEALGVLRKLPAGFRLVLRTLVRQPAHALMNVLGIASALAILVVGFLLFDSIDFLMDRQFRQMQQEDLNLTFTHEVSAEVSFELQRLPGVTAVETWRTAPARFRHGHLEQEVLVTAFAPGSRLRRLLDAEGRQLRLPSEGLLLSAQLANNLRLAAGDNVDVEWLDGRRLRSTLTIAATIDDYLGTAAYLSSEALQRATGTSALASGAWLATTDDDVAALYARLTQRPAVAGINSPHDLLQLFEAQMAKTLTVSSAFLLGFASLIAFGVLYNSARIALAERCRELASMRVMGFRPHEVAALLLGEQVVLLVLALPLGCAFGYWLTSGIIASIASDTYRMPLVAEGSSFAMAIAVVLLVSSISLLFVRRRLDRLDLIAALKTRE